MDTLMIYGMMCVENAKEKIASFLKEERGGAEIVATIILVAIVVLLAVFFREQLGDLVNNIWCGITDKTDCITKDF